MEYHSGGSLPLLGRPRYCPGANANGGYLCETGHCCGETGCCTYYYELWWFWLLWTVLILFSCCCAYRHRRAKLRVQQQQRQREISLLAYHGASSYPSSMLDLSFLASLKLPTYEEVAAQPSTPPPPYSSVFTAPRYPQPPRTTDPHLLTQHGPLLHQPLSDGPSSLSSDNSSSCSCDSCCPSSPCSSSLSAPVTYETDTSHASTPSEATPLTLDVTMETISSAASRLELNEAPFASERRKSATIAIDMEEPIATEINPALKQTVTVAVVARSASPLDMASPNSDLTLPVEMTAAINVSPTSLQSPNPSPIQTCIQSTAALKSNSPTPTTSPPASLNITRTLDTASSPTSPQQPRTFTLILDSAGTTCPDKNPSLIPISAPSNLIPNPDTAPSNLTQSPGEGMSSLTSNSGTISTSPIQNHVQTPETNLPSSPGEGTSTFTQTSQRVHSNNDLNLKLIPSPSQSPTERPSAPALGTVATNITQSSIPVLSSLLPSPSQGISNITTDVTRSSEEGLSNLPANLSQAIVSSDIKAQSQGAIVTNKMPEILSTDLSPSLVNAFGETTQNQEAVVTKSPSKEALKHFRSTETIATNLTPTNETLGSSLTKSLQEVPSSLPKTVLKHSTPSLENTTSDSVQIPVLISAHLDLTQLSESDLENVTQTTKSSPDSSFYTSFITLTNSSSQISDLPRQTETITASKSCSEFTSAPSDLECFLFPPCQDLSVDNCHADIASNLDPESVKSSMPESGPNLLSNPNVSPKTVSLNANFASDTGIALPTFVQKAEFLPEPTRDLPSPRSSFPQHPETTSVSKCLNSPPVNSSSLGLPPTQLASENLENSDVPPASDNYSFCPAITIQADPPSFATSPTSPCSIPSPTLPSPPVSTLLLDPLSALHPSDKSGASSGHASSLSPSPRNTQSPPKQTLFSPCVDVFEPVNPDWEDDEDEEQQDDDDYDDDDMGADESQYRHRRLTGDSGIEVCRCRVEDEDEDEEKLESEKDHGKDGTVENKLGGSTARHDSVDCPVRGQKSTGDELTLCSAASDTTPTSDDGGKVVIPLETV